MGRSGDSSSRLQHHNVAVRDTADVPPYRDTLHEGAQSGSGDEYEGAPQHKCAPYTWFLVSAAIDVAAVGYYGLFTGQRAECPSIDMLNKRGDRDYSKDTELLKNGDFHEYKGGRGEFLLIQSYDMFVSTLAQAVVRARTFAPGEKMSVFAVVTTPGQHPKKRIPLGFHGVSDQKEGRFLKRKEFACLYF